MNDGRLGRRIARLFVPYRPQLGSIMVIILVTSALSVASALLVRQVFDEALFPEGGGGVDLDRLYPLVAVLVAIPLVSGILNVIQTYLTNVVGNRVMRDLRDRLYAHLQRLSLAFFTSTRTGEVQSRLANDVGGVQTTITTTASSVVSNVVTVGSSIVAMLVLSVPLTVLSLILVPVFVVVSNRVGKRRRDARRETQVSLAEMSAITQETLSASGILLAKVFGGQRREEARYAAENARQVEVQVRQAMVGRSFFALTQAFFGISPALLYLVAGLQLHGGSANAISAGTLVAFTTLQTRLLFPINQLLQVSVDVRSSTALFRRVFEYMDLTPAIVDAPGALVLDPQRVVGRVELERVRFRYGPRGKPAVACPADSGLRFSVTHSSELALIACTTQADIGVDVEQVRELPFWLDVARRYFSEKELALVEAQPLADRIRCFLQIWTFKEAYGKALGEGVGTALHGVRSFTGANGKLFAIAHGRVHTMAHAPRIESLALGDEYVAAYSIVGMPVAASVRVLDAA